MRFSRPSRRNLLFSSLSLCVLAGAIGFQIARRADAQLESRHTLGGAIVAPTRNFLTPNTIAPSVNTLAINAAPAPTSMLQVAARPAPRALPAPPPIPDAQRIRVGLSTGKNTLAIWSADGLILRDLRQPARALRSAPGEIVKFNVGAPTQAQSGALSFRGPIALDLNGRKSLAWQYVAVAVPGDEQARVTSNGKSARYGRPYRGGFEVFPQQLAEVGHRENALSLVNVVNIEDYLKGVVPWEMEPGAPLEALKAQAMGARTKALDLRRTKKFAAGKFDICDYDACQGYPGTENEKSVTSRAVEETRGLAIYSGGRLIDSVFSTNSGGISANANDVWKTSGEIPYLQSIRDFAPNSPLSKIVKPSMSETDWRVYCSQSLAVVCAPDRRRARQTRATPLE